MKPPLTLQGFGCSFFKQSTSFVSQRTSHLINDPFYFFARILSDHWGEVSFEIPEGGIFKQHPGLTSSGRGWIFTPQHFLWQVFQPIPTHQFFSFILCPISPHISGKQNLVLIRQGDQMSLPIKSQTKRKWKRQ